MCQLTMMNIPKHPKLSRASIRMINEINTLSGNRDGFGFMLFDNPDEIVKVGDDAEVFWANNQNNMYENPNFNGIYHVRAASGTGNNREISDENAHPFRKRNLTLAHNGTLKVRTNLYRTKEQDKVEKLFEFSMIDSEKLLTAIDHYCGGNALQLEHINKGLELFYGPFALLIYDEIQPNKLFVIRGENRTLNIGEIFRGTSIKDNDDIIGTIINTGRWELMQVAKTLKTMYREFTGRDICIGVRELKKNTAYQYDINTMELTQIGEVKEVEFKDIDQIKVYNNNTVKTKKESTKQHSLPGTQNGGYFPSEKDSSTVGEIASLACNLNITIRECWILSELLMGKNLAHYDAEEMAIFGEFLELAQDKTFEGRIRQWLHYIDVENIDPLAVYKYSDIEFPFLINSKRVIKNSITQASEAIGGDK